MALTATGAWPTAVWNSPIPTMAMIPTMNRYVGTANARPDSRTPRRLTRVSTATHPTASRTRWVLSDGTAEMTLSTPAATETATVMT